MRTFDKSELLRFGAFVTALTTKGLTESEILAAAYSGKLDTLLGVVAKDKARATLVPGFVPAHARNRVSALDLLVRSESQ